MKQSIEKMRLANLLRKEMKFTESLEIYENLWVSNKDKFIAAGMLHCLRKLYRYSDAQHLITEVKPLNYNLDWLNNEVIWTIIESELLKATPNEPIENVLKIGEKILDLNPKGLALEKTVFTIIKTSKSANRWDIIRNWIDKLNPEELSSDFIKSEKGNITWSKQSLWYYYKANTFYLNKEYKQVIDMFEPLKGKFPKKQENFFIRLIALSYYNLGEYESSEMQYSNLYNNRVDWWLVHEYAEVVRSLGRKEEALKLMFEAASKGKKMENMVTLFDNIGLLCNELGRKEEAYYHLNLSKSIRLKKNWRIDNTKYTILQKLEVELNIKNSNKTTSQLLDICKKSWINSSDDKKNQKGNIRKALVGKVILAKPEAPFCFINTGEENIFCYKSNIPGTVIRDMKLRFDAIKSFDKKKQKESWKAININII